MKRLLTKKQSALLLSMGGALAFLPQSAAAQSITLEGLNPFFIEQNEAYNEPGFSALDASGNDISAQVVVDPASFDSSALGSFPIDYSINDASGNPIVTQQRTVNVIAVDELPVITVTNGNVSVGINDSYVDDGVTVTDEQDDNDADPGTVVTVTDNLPGAVDTSVAGVYTVIYTAEDSDGNRVQAQRQVTVTNDSPVITVNANPDYLGIATSLRVGISGAISRPYIDTGAGASDTEDGDLSASVSDDLPGSINLNVAGVNSITYSVTDSDGNESTAQRILTVTDLPPVVTLVNPAETTVWVPIGSAYVDAGATATDEENDQDDPPTPILLTSAADAAASVDTTQLGTYTVTYVAEDSEGNQAQAQRTVRVINDADGDGIADEQEALFLGGDADGDGVPNAEDADSDNDGIADALEFNAGNSAFTDDDGDTFPDPLDTDGDGLPDFVDRDSDNDRILDYLEASDPPVLFGNVPIANPVDALDTDGDDIPDYRDRDSDDDWIQDVNENVNIYPFSQAFNAALDQDSNGLEDFLEPAFALCDNAIDANANGIADCYDPSDIDADGLPNHRDVDSDDDSRPGVLAVDVGSDRREHAVFDGVVSAGDADGDGLDDAVDAIANIPVPLPNGRFTTVSSVTLNLDADALVNYLDIDNDNDGLPDVVELTPNAGGALIEEDTDGDSIPDYMDLDSDNDLLFDAVEAVDPLVRVLDGFVAGDLDAQDGLVDFQADQGTVAVPFESNANSDGDGIPDYRDTDSDIDGNGVEDIVDIRNGFSLNDNGTVDQVELDESQVPASFDLNDAIGTASNGVADAIEEAGSDTDDGISQERDTDNDRFGANPTQDSDFDSFANSSNLSDCSGSVGPDLDNDNDGISNTIENNLSRQDIDNDGLPNCLDLDSDNDGISDIAESGYIEMGLLSDDDGDGRIDNLVDTDPNGAHNATQFVAPVDTDGDGTPDFADRDSDDDGRSDLAESLVLPEISAIIDEITALPNSGASQGADGAIDISNRPNGEPLFLEFIDPARDVDGNGFIDRLQPGAVNSEVEVGTGGGGSVGLSGTLLLLFALLQRYGRRLLNLLVFSAAYTVAPLALAATDCSTDVSTGTPFTDDYNAGFARCFYLGAGGVFSLLDPEGEDELAFFGEEENGSGFKVLAGYRISRRFFVEAEYTDLGEAEISSSFVNSDASLEYSYSAIGGGMYLYPNSEQFNAFLRGAYASLDVKSSGDVSISQEDDNFFSWGGGLEYRQPATAWFARLTYDHISDDAQAVTFSINRYFGGPKRSFANRSGERTTEDDAPQGIVETIEQVSAKPDDAMAASDLPAAYADLSEEAIRQRDCELLDAPLPDFPFAEGEVTLSEANADALMVYAGALQRNPDLLVEVSTYANEAPEPADNRRLASRRAEAITDLFENSGVPAKQLLSRGFSGLRVPLNPSDSANAAAAGSSGSRVEFRVMNIGLCFE